MARGRTAWNRFTPFNIHMEATKALWCMCILKGLKRDFVGDSAVSEKPRAPGRWSGFEERSMTEVRVGS